MSYPRRRHCDNWLRCYFGRCRPVARVGDKISCGAVIETGADCTIIDGQPAAREGDTTSHGGTLIEGDSGWLI
nr:PAAR domain-containing protein [Pseudomonas putida]